MALVQQDSSSRSAHSSSVEWWTAHLFANHWTHSIKRRSLTVVLDCSYIDDTKSMSWNDGALQALQAHSNCSISLFSDQPLELFRLISDLPLGCQANLLLG